MEIRIDLARAKTKSKVLNIFGIAFGYTDEKNWGKNRDAFKDSLGYLDSGGIWGTNEIIRKPVIISIMNYNDFKEQAPIDFSILETILNDEKTKNPDFNFYFIEKSHK